MTARRTDLLKWVPALCLAAIFQGSATGRICVGDEVAGTSVRLSATPEPSPPLRFLFWPDPADQRDENAMPLFSRAVLMYAKARATDDVRNSDAFVRWLEGSWDEAYREDVEGYVARYTHVLAELEAATNRMQVKYPILSDELTPVEFYDVLLPELQQSRELARLLILRAKLEMHAGRWDDFSRTMQTLFRLSEMVGHSGNIIVGQLIGLSIAEVAMDRIGEASRRPNAPNFYWALAAVPRRLFDVRRSLDFESLTMLRNVPGLANLPAESIGEDQAKSRLRDFFEHLDGIANLSDAPAADFAGLSSAAFAVLNGIEPSRRFLRDETPWGERAAELSPSEVVLRCIEVRLERIIGDAIKWTWLPSSVRSEFLIRSKRPLGPNPRNWAESFEPASFMASLTLPAGRALVGASDRLTQQQAWLMTQQAIRSTAAGGEIPDELDDVFPPAWPDPVSRAPFGYTKTGPTTAVLTRPASGRGQKSKSIRVEITK